MPVRLTQPKATVTLDQAKVAAIKIEENPSQGSRWIEVWVVIGRLEDPADPTSFRQYADPDTGQLAAWYFKIEDGKHPQAPSQALGRCTEPTCRAWTPGQVAGACPVCGSAVAPYDGWTRLTREAPQGASIREAIARSTYAFLLTERVPDLATGLPTLLLDGTLE